MEKLFGVVPMDTLATVLGGTLAIALLILAVVGFRNRILVKLGLRNIPRRPAQTVLIVVGLMLSTMIITASLAVGDTVTHSIRSFVVTEGLGHTDETVRSAQLAFLGDDYMSAEEVDLVREVTSGDSRIDGVLPLINEILPVFLPRTSLTRARTDVRGFDVNSLGGFGELSTVDGDTVSIADLGESELYLNVDARTALDAQAGDVVILVTPTGRHQFTARAIVERGGLAAADPRVLMTLTSLQTALDRDGQVNRIDISNTGGIRSGLKYSEELTEDLRLKFTKKKVATELFDLLKGDEVVSAIEKRAESEAGLPAGAIADQKELARELRKPAPSDRFVALIVDETTGALMVAALEEAGMTELIGPTTDLLIELPTLRVNDIKQQLLDLADFVGSIFTTFLMIFGSFSIIVGLLLIFLVFVMLAAAREQEMGMARALGMKRGHLIRMFTFEGTAYALLAGVIGVALGIIAAIILVSIMEVIFADPDDAFTIRLAIQPRSLVAAFSAGVLLTMLTVSISAYRVSKLSIVSAIRGLPEELVRTSPPRFLRRLLTFVLAVLTPLVILLGVIKAPRDVPSRLPRASMAGNVPYESLHGRAIRETRGNRAGDRRGILRLLIFVFSLALVWSYRILRWISIYLLFPMLSWPFRIFRDLYRLFSPYNRTGLPALFAGADIAALGINLSSTALWTSGASLFLLGGGQAIGAILRRLGVESGNSKQLAATLSSGSILVFWSLPFDTLEFLTGELSGNIEMFILSGSWMVGSATFLIMNNAGVLTRISEAGLGRFGSLKPVLRTAIAYPMAAKFRTGLTIAMFSMVIFTLIVFAILNGLGDVIEDEPDRVTGGYDIQASISRDLPIADITKAIADAPELANMSITGIAASASLPGEGRRIGIDDVAYKTLAIRGYNDFYLGSTKIEFTHRDPMYGATDREIWEALRTDPSLAVMSAVTIIDSNNIGGPSNPFRVDVDEITGDSEEQIKSIQVTVRPPGGRGDETTRTVIAFMDALANGMENADDGGGPIGAMIISRSDILQDVSPIDVPFTDYQFRVGDPSIATDIASRLETAFLDNSMDADSYAQLIKESREQDNAFNLLFQGYMSLGLLVGVAALGVTSFRTVVERRQSIGMMRAIGYKGWMIQAGFLIENSIIALIGITLGIGLGTLISWNIVKDISEDIEGLKFAIPWLDIMVIVAISYSFALAMSYWPARQASKIYPSEALRYE